MDETFPAEKLRQQQILAAAMMTGPALFLVAVLAFPTGAAAPDAAAPPATLYLLLTVANAVVLASSLAVRTVLSTLFRRQRTAANFWEKSLAIVVVRYAVLEGSAIICLIILLLASLNHVLPEHPWIYANLVSFLVLWSLGILDFPSAARLRREWRRVETVG